MGMVALRLLGVLALATVDVLALAVRSSGRGSGRGRAASRSRGHESYWREEDSFLLAKGRRRRGPPLPRGREPFGEYDEGRGGEAPRQQGRKATVWTSEVGSSNPAKAAFHSGQSFAELGASPELETALKRCGAPRPSHVQALSFSSVLGGKDVAIADQTGSGKTLAYLAPIVQALRSVEAGESRTRPGEVRVLVLVPTSELAQQVLRVAKGLSASGMPFRSAIITGDHSWRTQKRCADAGLELLVATPGRLHAHLVAEEPSFSLADLRYVVLDEVDIMYSDEDFTQLWAEIRAATPPRAAHCFVTATMPPHIRQDIWRDFPLTKSIEGPGLHMTRSGVRQKLIDCSGSSSTSTLEQSADLKLDALIAELDEEPVDQTLIFCNTISSCRRVENGLRRRDRRGERYEVDVFHGAIPPEARRRAIARLTEPHDGSARRLPRLLVCTDRASRGMDFPQVQHVVLFDFPRDGIEFVRRVGRATRGGNAPGRVTSLALGRQLPYAKLLMKTNEGGDAIDLQTHG